MRIIIAALLALAMISQPALALDVGITPDSPLYPIKRILEELDLLFTFDEVKKAEKMLNYAKLRLAEAKKMAEEGKVEFVGELLKDYTNYMNGIVELMKSAKPNDAPKIAEIMVNESLDNLEKLDELSAIVGEDVKSAEIATVMRSVEALDVLKTISPSEAYRMNIVLAKGLLKLANEKAEEGKDFDFLVRESERLLNESKAMLKGAKGTSNIEIVETIREIIDEATNLSLIEKPEDRNVTTDIIEKGLEIYKKLGVDSFIR